MDKAFLYAVIFVLASFSVVVDRSDAAGLCSGLKPGEIFIFPHESNCTLYYICYNGDQTLQSCPSGLYYNNRTQSCDFDKPDYCRAIVTTTPSPGDPRCKGVQSDYFPHLSDCSRYIECYKGNSYQMSCPPGYHYNEKRKLCTLPEFADCKVTTPTPRPTSTTPHPLCWGVRPGQVVLKAVDGDCQAYWRCDGNVLTQELCPPYLYFDEELQLCDFPDKVHCIGTTGTGPTSPTTPGPSPSTPQQNDPRCKSQPESIWPHPTICSRYIECHKGQSYDLECPRGLHFNATLHRCVDANKSECGIITTTTQRTTRDPNVTTHPNCPAGGRFLFPHKGDCSKYDECAEGILIVRDCPPGLWFNPTYLVCDYKYQAGCKENGRNNFLDAFFSYYRSLF